VAGLSLILVPALVLTSLATPPAAPSVTLASLLCDTADLALLADLPAVPFTTHQISSHDRLSVTRDDAEGWFANHDRSHFLYDGVVEKETPFFRTLPRRGGRPDGQFPAGTKVGIARQRRAPPGLVWAYATDMDGKPSTPVLQGYIRQDAWTQNPGGPVLADILGPGCLTRIWSSNPGEAGIVRIFLDNAAKPALEGKLLDLISGRWEVKRGGTKTVPIPPPFAGERAGGYTLIFPVPFAKRCLVTVERPQLQYQIEYRRYPAGTAVESFQLDELLKRQPQVLALAHALTTLTPPEPVERSRSLGKLREDEEPDVRRDVLDRPLLEPGETRRLDLLQPPGLPSSRAIIQLRCQVQAEVLADALRTVVLTVTFDSADKPHIRVPLGDFFGTAPGANSITTLPTRATAGGQLTAHWVMPYSRNARIELSNLGTRPATVKTEVLHVPRPWTSQSLHLHAKWRCDLIPTRPFQDWSLVTINGAGHYVGTALSVFNPVRDWWGEGDSKVWVDGETYPSHWGTGTDDDFGCGWADRSLFSQAWHAQSRRDGKAHQGFCSLFRGRLLDRITFTKSLRYAIEVRHDQPGQRVQYAATAYWYARPGGTDDAPEITAEGLRGSLSGSQP